MNKQVHLFVSGRVQGVCFRAFAREQAIRSGLVGWVRNRTDGRVEIKAEGPETDVAEFVAWCRHGPGHARVTDVELTYGPATGAFASFEIAYGLDPDVWNP